MFVKYSENQYRFDCGQNKYDLVLHNSQYTITGNARLYIDYGPDGFNYDIYIDSDSGIFGIYGYYSLEELVFIFNEQIVESYDVGGSKYIESKKIIENIT